MSKAQILLFGTFHFQDGGFDAYQPTQEIDILSPERQNELHLVLDQLSGFKPTKVAIERRSEQQTDTDHEYSRFLDGSFALPASETYQLGFKIAARFSHARLYCVDVWGRYYSPPVDLEPLGNGLSPGEFESLLTDKFDFDPFRDLTNFAESHDQRDVIPQWMSELQRAGQADDSTKMTRSLRETFLQMNTEKAILESHSSYLSGPFKIGHGQDYLGVDYVCAWYSRNLRIFANLQRITESPNDRIILIIGSGHLPILRHCVLSSPEHELAEVRNYLE